MRYRKYKVIIDGRDKGMAKRKDNSIKRYISPIEVSRIDRLQLVKMDELGDKLFEPYMESNELLRFELLDRSILPELLNTKVHDKSYYKKMFSNTIYKLPHIFNQIVVESDANSLVVIRDTGKKLDITGYNRFGKRDYEWIWNWQTTERTCMQRMITASDGRDWCFEMATGTSSINWENPVTEVLRLAISACEKKNSFVMAKTKKMLADSGAYNEYDLEIIFSGKYTTKEIREHMEPAIFLDGLLVIMDYIYTLYFIASTKKMYEEAEKSESTEVKKDKPAVKKERPTEKNIVNNIAVHKVNMKLFDECKVKVRAEGIRETIERVYTTAQWERRGTTRHYKNGKSVPVRPTTAKRKKELLKGNTVVIKEYKGE